ncbi:hypothetical protein YEEN111655_18245 [Yersinia entomophaga]
MVRFGQEVLVADILMATAILQVERGGEVEGQATF